MISISTYTRTRRRAQRLTVIVFRRSIHSSAQLWSGHNRWSKIKHDKGKNDDKKTRTRTAISAELTLVSKTGGPNVSSNSRLAQVIEKAKQSGLPKTQIEAAIHRGQGRSTTGGVLENVTIECMGPGSAALIVECQSDNKKRTLQDVRLIIKQNNGLLSPTRYCFQQRGLLVYEGGGVALEDILEPAIEAGAEDVELDVDSNIEIFTAVSSLNEVIAALAQTTNLKLLRSEMPWVTNPDTAVEVTEASSEALDTLVAQIQEHVDVQAVYVNSR